MEDLTGGTSLFLKPDLTEPWVNLARILNITDLNCTIYKEDRLNAWPTKARTAIEPEHLSKLLSSYPQ